jgi:hypothetical protein
MAAMVSEHLEEDEENETFQDTQDTTLSQNTDTQSQNSQVSNNQKQQSQSQSSEGQKILLNNPSLYILQTRKLQVWERLQK